MSAWWVVTEGAEDGHCVGCGSAAALDAQVLQGLGIVWRVYETPCCLSAESHAIEGADCWVEELHTDGRAMHRQLILSEALARALPPLDALDDVLDRMSGT